MTERPRVFLDTESTRLPPNHRPWEIALVSDYPTGTTEVVIVVTDLDLSDADPKSLAMNGFHDRHPKGDRFAGEDPTVMYLTESDTASALEFLLDKVEIVCAQPPFDLECIGALLSRNNAERTWHYRTRDIESLAEGFLRRPVGGLQDCAKLLDVEVDPLAVHSALGDARLVRACWHAMFGSYTGTV